MIDKSQYPDISLTSWYSGGLLGRSYFAGGGVAAYSSRYHFAVDRDSISESFEDGTVSFLDILALNVGCC